MQSKNELATKLEWAREISNLEPKRKVAQQIAQRVRNNDVIGVGSGSTSFLAIQEIAKKVTREGLNVTAVTTSAEVALTCTVLGLRTSTLSQLRPDWAFDGADEVDPANNLIKGRGGAMFLEKLVLKSSPENYILVDESKIVSKLGEKFPVPIEVFPAAIHYVQESLMVLGATFTNLRLAKSKDGPVVTEAGNFIIDARFSITHPELEREIKLIPGVIESGLFMGYDVNIIKS